LPLFVANWMADQRRSEKEQAADSTFSYPWFK